MVLLNSKSRKIYWGENMPNLKLLPAGFSITAHAGALGLPENTIPALLKAIESGVDIVEMDVSFRPDGMPVIIHKDAPGQDEGVPLIDAFKAVKVAERIKVNLDLKSIRNLAVVQEHAGKEEMLERVFFTGVDKSWVEPVRTQCKLIPCYLNASTDKKQRDSFEYAQSFAEKLLELNCVGLNCHFGEISKTLIDVLHDKGLLVSVWTLDKKADMKKMLSMAVDNITTRKPDKLIDLLAAMKQ